jgi:hypothetical protein
VDLFLAYSYHDEDFASGLEDDLAGRGNVVGEPLPLWPGLRLLPQIDQRLHESCQAIVIVSGVPGVLLAPQGTGRTHDTQQGRCSHFGHRGGGRDSLFPRLAVAAFPGSHT